MILFSDYITKDKPDKNSFLYYTTFIAGVVELVYTYDSKSYAVRLVSSSLTSGTSEELSNSPRPVCGARQSNYREFGAKKTVDGFKLVKENFFILFVAEIPE